MLPDELKEKEDHKKGYMTEVEWKERKQKWDENNASNENDMEGYAGEQIGNTLLHFIGPGKWS